MRKDFAIKTSSKGFVMHDDRIEDVLNCRSKDEMGLNDFQKLNHSSGIFIPWVGITQFRIPLLFRHEEGQVISHDVEASMFCSLKKEKTGVNMSRFCSILQEEGRNVVDPFFFKAVLSRFKMELRDYPDEEPVENVRLKLDFSYPVKQRSLKSDNWGWQYYPCQWEGIADVHGKITMKTTLHYEYSSTCPCSLSLARQYEEKFKKGITSEGKGVASAHAQRSRAVCHMTSSVDAHPTMDELIRILREALPTETQSMVKRIDEQAFAILNGENPMFVEDAVRKLSFFLNQDKRILDWVATVEHFESLHGHNASATISKVH